jgi:ABC-2 family transporter
MRTIIDIARNDLRIAFNDRSIWVNLVLIPIALAFVVGYANGAASGTPTAATVLMDVTDQDNSATSQDFITRLRAANTSLILCPMDNNDSDVCQLGGAAFDDSLAQTRLKDQTSLAWIEIPANFGADLTAGNTVNLIYRSNEDATAPSFILQAVQSATQSLGGAQIAANVGMDIADNYSALHFKDDTDRAAFRQSIYGQAASLWAQQPISVEYSASPAPGNAPTSSRPGFGQSVPGMASMYVMFTVLPLMVTFIQERKTWTLQRLVVMPVSRAQILGGKILARFTLGMIQYAVIFGFGLLLGVRYGHDPVAMLALMISFTLCITALTMALTTLMRREEQARGISLFLTLTLAPLGGAWWPLEIVPDFMQKLGHISPVAWVMDGYHSLMFFDGNLSTVLLPIGVLLLATAVCFVFGVVRFKYE